MLYGRITDANHNCICEAAMKATNAWERARGLLARKPLTVSQGLWLQPCPSVHTIGMSYSLDIVFLDSEGYVKKIVPALKPLRFAACQGATATLELVAGQAAKKGIQTGIQLIWELKDRK